MRQIRLLRSASFLACSLAFLGSNVAMAQDTSRKSENQQTESDSLGDIVVTAQRRSENLQNVPMAVTAISGDNLKALGVQSTVDIQRFAPGVTFASTAGEGQKSNVVVRGVGLNTSSETLESNVGIYFDNVYMASTSGFSNGLFDVDRVEILRGPQGTLYGNTSTGGLIHYISRRPSEKLEAFANLSYGSYNQVRIEAAAGGKLASGVSARISGLFDRNDGYIRNSLGKDKNSKNLWGIRGQLLFEPSAGISILLRGRYSRNHPDEGASFKPRVAYLNPATGLIEALPSTVNFFGAKSCNGCDAAGNPNSIADGSIWRISANQAGALDVESYGGGAEISADLGFATLNSITDWSVVKKYFQEDSDAAPRTTVSQLSDLNARQFQQEVRLSSSNGAVKWQIGGFYLRRNVDSLFQVNFLGSDGAFPPWQSQSPIDNYRSRAYAVYGQAEVPIGEKLSVIGGLRYSKEDANVTGVSARLFADGSRTITQSYDLANEWDGFSGKVSLQYKPRNGTLVYASYARGLRPSNIVNTGTNRPAGVDVAVKSERLNAFEIGLKHDFDNVPVRFNLSAYYYDYKDMQTRAFLGLSSFNLNVNAEVYGIDAEISARPIDGLNLSANLGYLHGRVKDVPRRGLGTVRDTELPNAPSFSASAQARYEWSVGSGGNMFVLLAGSYRTHTYAEIENNPVQRVEGYFLADGRVGFTTKGGRLEVGASANNIFNKQYFTFIGAVSSIGIAQQFPGRPRWLGVYANIKY